VNLFINYFTVRTYREVRGGTGEGPEKKGKGGRRKKEGTAIFRLPFISPISTVVVGRGIQERGGPRRAGGKEKRKRKRKKRKEKT